MTQVGIFSGIFTAPLPGTYYFQVLLNWASSILYILLSHLHPVSHEGWRQVETIWASKILPPPLLRQASDIAKPYWKVGGDAEELPYVRLGRICSSWLLSGPADGLLLLPADDLVQSTWWAVDSRSCRCQVRWPLLVMAYIQTSDQSEVSMAAANGFPATGGGEGRVAGVS